MANEARPLLTGKMLAGKDWILAGWNGWPPSENDPATPMLKQPAGAWRQHDRWRRRWSDGFNFSYNWYGRRKVAQALSPLHCIGLFVIEVGFNFIEVLIHSNGSNKWYAKNHYKSRLKLSGPFLLSISLNIVVDAYSFNKPSTFSICQRFVAFGAWSIH